MRKLIEFFGNQGLFADLSTVFVLIFGIYSMMTIERKVMPNVQFEWVTVTTVFPGASSEEVERLIINPLEQDLNEVDGIKKMTSTSMDGRGFIGLQLDPDETTVEQGKTDVQDVVDRFTDLPDGAEDPLVIAAESSQNPVIQVALSGDVGESVLRQTAKDLEKELEKINGVAKIEVEGLRDIEYRVEARPDLLRRYQLTLDDLVLAIERQNISVPGGLLEGARNGRDLIVRTVGEFKDIDDVRNAVVRANSLGQPIRVRDVAEVREAFEKAEILQRANGLPAMNLTVLKKEKADAVTVVDLVKEKLDELKPKFTDGISLAFVNDSSYYVRRRLGVLTNNLFIGLALVLLIMTLVMPWRVSLITAIGIPFAFLGAIYIMDYQGISFNLITMMGLIIVVGMLVDDAVVVTENIVRFMEKGMDPLQAAIKGAQQIWAPVTASVLTTIVAFAPMTAMSGIFGKFVKYIPIAVILALIISLYECFFILPHHLARWAGPSLKNKKRSLLTPIREGWEKLVAENYLKVLEVCLRRRYIVFVLSFFMIVGTLGFASKNMSFVLFPKDGVEAFVVNAEAPVGTPLEDTLKLIRPIEEELSRIPKTEMDDYTTKIGIQRLNVTDANSARGTQFAQMIVYLKPELERERTAVEIAEDVKKKVSPVAGLKKVSFEQINPGPPVGKAISIGVNGRDYEDILPAVAALKKLIQEKEGAREVVDSYIPGKDEVRIIVDQAEATAAGLSVAAIGRSVRAAYEGLVASTIRLLDEEIDIRVSLPQTDRSDENSLGKIKVPNAQGSLVPLERVAEFEKGTSISQYDHENNQRRVSVFGEVDEKVTSSREINEALRKEIPELSKRFPNVTFTFGGEDEDTQESLKSFVEAGITAILGIFMILVLTFRNLYQPILVVMTIPLGVIAIIWGFAIRGMPMSFLGVVGLIALAGVIVNNSIVMIDFVNKRREEGHDRFQSIIEAGRTRIRPIFLTTLTTVCGIFPTAYGWGGLDQFVVPVAMALGWGILFGSLQGVFVLPAMIAIQDDIILWLKKIFGRAEKAS